MNSLVWVFSIVLALVLLIVGQVRVFKDELAADRFPRVEDVPRTLVIFIGLAETLGAPALVLPVATGILPWPTPVVAAAPAILMRMAGTFHGQRREPQDAGVDAILPALTAFVAYGRWPLLATF